MARIEISSVSNPYGTGELQLQGKVAMSGTLTAVTDNLNNASPLKLSTGGVQVASTLQITTNSNPYIDAEDGAGNNRFQVGRDPSSQVVNVDFASNPTGGTNQVGAIRTYRDGVSLSDVMTFRKDGYINAKGQVQVGTDGQDGVLIFPTTTSGFATSIYTGYANNRLTIQCGSATLIKLSNTLDLINSGNSLIIDGGTHTTSLNTNSLTRFVNTGTPSVNTTYFVNTNVGVNETSPTAKLQIKGSGSTSATTSLLVQNSGGTQSLRISDDGTINTSYTAPVNINFLLSVMYDITARTLGGNSGALGLIGQSQGNASATMVNIATAGSPAGTIGTSLQISAFPLQGATHIGVTYNGNYTSSLGVNTLIGYDFSPTNYGGSTLRAFQSSVGGAYINTTSYNASAILQADSTTQGFLPPRMTTIEKNAIVTPAIGLMVFDTTLNRPCFYNGAWVTL